MLSNKTPLVAGSIPAREKEVETSTCFCSLVVECLPSKEVVRVRFPTEAKRVKSARRPRSSVDRAPDFGSGGRGFDPYRGHARSLVLLFVVKKHLVDTET